MSETFRQYLAGQLYCLPHILPLFAPTINSFKRLVEGAWAPTTLTWGIDNRTVALRVLPAGEKSSRLETRVIGSDVNPYLAMAGALGAGLYGIKKKLKLSRKATTGNGYSDLSNGVLPRTLEEAILWHGGEAEASKEAFRTMSAADRAAQDQHRRARTEGDR